MQLRIFQNQLFSFLVNYVLKKTYEPGGGGGGLQAIMAYTGRLRMKEVCQREGISRVEVYDRVRKSLI